MSTAAPDPSGSVDFGRAFTSVTEDPDWIKKVLIGGAFTLLSSILVGVPFVLGYFGRTLRNVVADAPRPLPEWDDLGGLFSEGLRLTAVSLIYGLAIAAVCDDAPRIPAAVRPPFTATIGLLRETRCAMRANLRGFPNDSR